MKSILVNCDTALILEDRENFLETLDGMTVNCDSIAITDELYATAIGKGALFNTDSISVIAKPKNPVRVSGILTLDENSDYSGAYLVCDDVIVTPGGVEKLAAMEGLFVLKRLYCPEGSGSALTAKIRARKIENYPAGAKVVLGDAWLDGRKWESGAQIYASGTLYATDEAAVRAAREQGTTFCCKKLYIGEGMLEEFGPMFSSDQVIAIPEGYAFAKDGKPLVDLYATYGEKVFLAGDVTVQPQETKHLSLLTSLIVKGNATLPLEHLAACKAVIKADRVTVFEGELMRVNGFQTVGHGMLSAANAEGTKYTMQINGFALFDEDVTLEDVKAIASLKVNGSISAPKVLHAHLSAVAGNINGTMLPSISELKEMLETMPEGLAQMIPAQFAGILGVESEKKSNATVINCDSYVLM